VLMTDIFKLLSGLSVFQLAGLVFKNSA